VVFLARYGATISLNDISTIKDMRLAVVDGGTNYTPPCHHHE